MSATQGDAKKRHPAATAAARFFFYTFLIVIVPGLWSYSPIRQAVCSWSHTPQKVDELCPIEDRRVSDSDAEHWIDSMIARVRGTQRADGVVGNMTTFGKDASARQAFVQEWNWAIYAERIDPVARTANASNEFDTVVNVFDVPAEHQDPSAFFQTPYTKLYRVGYVFRLTRTEDGIKALRINRDHDTYSPMGTYHQNRVDAAVKTDNYRSFDVVPDGKKNWPAGKPGWEICQLRATYGPLAGQWFARTYLGLTPHADLDEPTGRVSGVVRCDKRPS